MADPCEVGLESTIVGIGEKWHYHLPQRRFSHRGCRGHYRAGFVMEHSASQPDAPGMLSSHYAPRRPLIMGDLATLVQNLEVATLQ